MHVVGVLYTIPVTRLSGNIAIYEPERTVGHGAHKSIRIIHPRPLLNTIFLFAAPTITFILGVVPALISAYLYDIGDYKSSKVWLEVRHWDWSVLFVTMSVMDIYYGIKFTRILKINILIAESIQGTPCTPFGLSNVRSKSPARFLLITHRIFLVGLISLGTVFAIAQTASIVFRDTLAKAGISLYTHFCTVMWTCTLPVATLIFLMMVHVQLLRNKRFRLLSNSSYRKMESKEDGSRDLGPEPAAGPVHRRTTTGNDPTIETVLELEQVTREGRREEGTEDPTRMSTPQTAAMRANSKHPRAFSSQRISSIENGLWDGYSQYLSSKEWILLMARGKSPLGLQVLGYPPPPQASNRGRRIIIIIITINVKTYNSFI
ncbi:hypothetical protein BGZ67_007438 [Mortierella alpina]|nr:hypothetical protein BGZ67_007438 [Mortierella alpina]